MAIGSPWKRIDLTPDLYAYPSRKTVRKIVERIQALPEADFHFG